MTIPIPVGGGLGSEYPREGDREEVLRCQEGITGGKLAPDHQSPAVHPAINKLLITTGFHSRESEQDKLLTN